MSFDINKININEKVKESILNMKDIAIDDYCDKGQNDVFFGRHNIFNCRVALKYYYYGEDSHKEVQLLKSISHKNIIKVWDARTVGNGWAYFITDEIREGDLDAAINSKNLGQSDAVKIVRGVLNGLGVMHSAPNRILHRDLKPANILLGKNHTSLIADFGSVKIVPEDNELISSSKHSPLYRPPEAYNPGVYTFASDIYQVGIILFQLLGGKLSYFEMDYLTVRQKNKYNKLKSDFDKSNYVDEVLLTLAKKSKLLDMDSLPFFMPLSLRRIIKSAVNPDYKLRFKSTYEFLLDLHKIGEIQNWFIHGDHYVLKSWKGKDYRIVKKKDEYLCETKNCSNQNWRKDSYIKSGLLDEVYMNLSRKIS